MLLILENWKLQILCVGFWFIGGGVDYNSGPYIVTFPAGVTTASFNISITDDNILENNEDIQVEINVSSLHSTISVSNPGQATVTIVDNDSEINFIITYIFIKVVKSSHVKSWNTPFVGS